MTSASPLSSQPIPQPVAAVASARQLGEHSRTFAHRRTVWRKLNAKRLHLFAHGIVVSGAEEMILSFRYDAMTLFQEVVSQSVNGVQTGTFHTYTVLRPDGTKLKLPDCVNPEQWGPEIQQGLVNAQFPVAQNAIAQGDRLQFGKLTLDHNGVTTPKGTASWREIQRVDIDKGVLVLAKSGHGTNWFRIQVRKIPNFFIAYHLMRGMHQP
ncbi:hypothetical protein LO772_17030 [Yinghuangia sp. ASG 101]|uniref:DUF6585 family protein n=1 Tax=Yinghuangia sp. ASG 101 TaxID=2896848 RepID=UPI001E36E0C3|nr:DUF6585 family protein [Yinghuangia sp. ASG 101]UGQ15116.1 hypothetical protein LO772_17030 [Yinghuangia sp. ASG 101]